MGTFWPTLDGELGREEELINEDCLVETVGDGCDPPVPGVKGLAFGLKAIRKERETHTGGDKARMTPSGCWEHNKQGIIT